MQKLMQIGCDIKNLKLFVPFPQTVIDPFESPVTTSPFAENSIHVKYCGISYFCQNKQTEYPPVTKDLQSKYSAHSAYYLGMTFINREWIALLESKFHFQIEYCNVPMVALFQMRNADWLIIDIRRMFTCKWQTVSGLLCLM